MQAKVIKSTSLAKEVFNIVEENIEANNVAMLENVFEAAKASKHRLSIRQGEWIGLKRVGHDRMHHRQGWKVYRENWYRAHNVAKKPDRRTAAVASSIEPSLTHLIEFGHRVVYGSSYQTDGVQGHWKVDTGRRTRAFNYIKDAYEVGAKKLLETSNVDNP